MNYPELETLKLERRGPVGWLINNRPDQLNAMNARMRDEFEIAWRALDADPEVRVIVHTGEGRAFQTGVDVHEIATDGEGMQRYRESVEKFDLHFTAWHNEVWKPVITAVNGICAGGGFHWIADADIVIAASDAQFFDPHVSIGQVVSIEAIGLMKRMPVEAVMRMAFVGRHERMPAQRAYELGMVSEVVDPPERLRDAAQELAEKIARNSPAAMAATKRALWGALELGPHRRVPGRSARARLDVGPSRPGGRPARVRREARAATGSRSTHARSTDDRGRDRHRDRRVHRAARRARRRRSTGGTSATTCTRRPPPGPARSPGARWVATRACKAVRPPGATWFGEPARGSFLTTVWLLDGSQAGVGRLGRAADGGPARRRPIACSRAAITCTPRCTASCGEARAGTVCRRRPRSTTRSRASSRSRCTPVGAAESRRRDRGRRACRPSRCSRRSA